MNKQEIKENGQEVLMFALQTAFGMIEQEDSFTANQKKLIIEAASKEMARIEKLFGYEPNSWKRGC